MSLVRQAEIMISNVLRIGVLLSGAVILVGVVLYYTHPQAKTSGALSYPHTLGAVIPGILAGNAEAVITLGLLILLATPVLRVAVSIGAFALEHDWLYVGITTLVLALLLSSILVLGEVFGKGTITPQTSPYAGRLRVGRAGQRDRGRRRLAGGAGRRRARRAAADHRLRGLA